jgi:hypothetical protein
MLLNIEEKPLEALDPEVAGRSINVGKAGSTSALVLVAVLTLDAASAIFLPSPQLLEPVGALEDGSAVEAAAMEEMAVEV